MNAHVGNVVLIKNEAAAGMDFQRGRVVKAIPREEGHMRSVEVEYKNPTLKVFRRTVHPHSENTYVVVIVPVV
jgi:hypothetical protein